MQLGVLVIVSFLTLALLTSSTTAVKCYSCADCATVSSSTLTATNSVCQKSTYGSTVNRAAVPTCTPSSTTVCCSTDLCNEAAPSVGRSSVLMLTVAVATVAYILGFSG
ncbi:hypothetical protein BOX15_Mlig017753g1 [Macrostomum lignano]|uniref:UPAR/Ly6 domain-containing protein n=1 Tax=Macrostomum lignano TaxID=282301 RepID=A0A267EV55_9PLAT|nr:hypothetical protein BOX15_Mlig017753g1 [Macrostomum lignano]